VDGVWDGVWTNITGTSGGSPSPVAIAGGDTPGWSEFWISGNGIRKFHESDTTVIDMDTVGGAVVRQGAAAGSKNVMLPISIMAMSNGRTGTIHGVTVRWKTETASDKLVSILMRKQTGLCSTADCYVNIVNGIGENYDCDPSSHPHGCGILYSVNSPLESGSQIYLTLELSFASETNHIWIGGVQIGVSYQ
jgi:hypothetical protein